MPASGGSPVSAWTPAARRMGVASGLSVALIGALYVATGLAWLASRGEGSPPAFEPGEPYRFILELLILVTAPVLVLVATSIYAYAPAQHKAWALGALALM